MIDEELFALEAHVVLAAEDLSRMEAIKTGVRERVEAFGIGHSTLEVEFPEVAGDPDHDGSLIA